VVGAFGDVVPVADASSSYEGLAGRSTVSSLSKPAITENKRVEVVWEGRPVTMMHSTDSSNIMEGPVKSPGRYSPVLDTWFTPQADGLTRDKTQSLRKKPRKRVLLVDEEEETETSSAHPNTQRRRTEMETICIDSEEMQLDAAAPSASRDYWSELPLETIVTENETSEEDTSELRRPTMSRGSGNKKSVPPYTDRYVQIAAKKKQDQVVQKEARLKAGRSKATKRTLRKISENLDLDAMMKKKSLAELTTALDETANTLLDATTSCRNLKGPFMREFYTIALKVERAASAIKERIPDSGEHTWLRQERATLREENRALKKQIEEQGKALEALRQTAQTRPRIKSSLPESPIPKRTNVSKRESPVEPAKVRTGKLTRRIRSSETDGTSGKAKVATPNRVSKKSEDIINLIGKLIDSKMEGLRLELLRDRPLKSSESNSLNGTDRGNSAPARKYSTGNLHVTEERIDAPENTWALVTKRSKRKRRIKGENTVGEAVISTRPIAGNKNRVVELPTSTKKLPSRPPRTAAVTISLEKGATSTLTKAMTKARTNINFENIGIKGVKPKEQ